MAHAMSRPDEMSGAPRTATEIALRGNRSRYQQGERAAEVGVASLSAEHEHVDAQREKVRQPHAIAAAVHNRERGHTDNREPQPRDGVRRGAKGHRRDRQCVARIH